MTGSALTLGLGAAYLAGVNAPEGLIHIRARHLSSAAADGFSQGALQREAAITPGALSIARRQDPILMAGAPQRDRQAIEFAARLERADPAPYAPTAASLMLRPSLEGADPSSPVGRFRFAALDALDSARDLECLTQAVYYEARGESGAGQAAVAQVVLNRVRHPAFPKTVCGVVFQGAANGDGCQFSFVCDGSMRGLREGAAWSRAQRVAARALGGFVMAGIGNATHFHAVRLGQQWGDGLVRVGQIGLHVFYRFGHPRPAEIIQADGARPASDHPAPADAEAIKPVYASFVPPSAELAPQPAGDKESVGPADPARSAAGAQTAKPNPAPSIKADGPSA